MPERQGPAPPPRVVIVPRLAGGWLVRGAAAGMPNRFCHTIEGAHDQARRHLEAAGGGEVVVREGSRVIRRTVITPPPADPHTPE